MRILQFSNNKLLPLLAAIFAGITMPAHAQLHPLVGVPEVAPSDVVKHASAIFVGTVTSIDESAITGLDSSDPNYGSKALTKVTFHVDDAIAATDADAEVEVVLRGGIRRDGLIETWSAVPDFSVGDQYLISLRNDRYTMLPFVPGFAGVLRFDRDSKKDILVDSSGHSIAIDANGLLSRVKKVASSMQARRQKQRDEARSSTSIDISSNLEEFPVPSDDDRSQASSANALLSEFRQASAGLRSAADKSAKRVFHVIPEPLEGKLAAATPSAD